MMTESNRNDLFYTVFNIKEEDRPLFPEDIGNNVVFNTQSDLIAFIKANEKMLQEYREVLNPIWQEADGICRHLCGYVAVHNLLANKEAFFKIFLNDHYTNKEVDEESKKSLKSLANDLIDEVENGKVDLLSVKKLQIVYNKLKEIIKTETCSPAFKEFIKACDPDLLKKSKLLLKNQEMLTEKHLRLAETDKDDYVALYFNSTTRRYGHVTLIRKNGDNDFAFYDPNLGAVFGLTKKQLCKIVTQVFYQDTYLEKNKLNSFILALAIAAWLVLIVAAAVAAVYSYNTIAAILLIVYTIDLVACYYLSKHLKYEIPYYDTIKAVTSSDMEYNKNELQKISKELDDISAELEKCPDKQNGELEEVQIAPSKSGEKVGDFQNV